MKVTEAEKKEENITGRKIQTVKVLTLTVYCVEPITTPIMSALIRIKTVIHAIRKVTVLETVTLLLK